MISHLSRDPPLQHLYRRSIQGFDIQKKPPRRQKVKTPVAKVKDLTLTLSPAPDGINPRL
jgi:hypothetical protein